MIGPLDTGLEFYRQVLNLRADRQQLLTADIANASTPGFKAIDLDFGEALAAAEGGGKPSGLTWLVDDPQHLKGPTESVCRGRRGCDQVPNRRAADTGRK